MGNDRKKGRPFVIFIPHSTVDDADALTPSVPDLTPQKATTVSFDTVETPLTLGQVEALKV
jgi:hypothetical protein